MLDALYRKTIAKPKQADGEEAVNYDIMLGRSSSFISEDATSAISSTLFTDYMYKSTTRANSDDRPTANNDSTVPMGNVKIIDYQKDSSNRMQSKIQKCCSHPPNSIEHKSDDNQTLPKLALKAHDSCPYVLLSSEAKKCFKDTRVNNDHGDYIEYDDIASKRIVIGQNHDNES